MSLKLDKKSRQILYQLDLNSRQSNNSIAKKIGLSKDTVSYRIENLESSRIIRGYNAIIDSSKLGYLFYRVYLNLIDVNQKILKDMIEFLKSEKSVWWIARVDGAWNFIFAIWVKSNQEFRDFFNNRFYSRFRQNIKDRLICPVTAYKQYARSYLLENQKELKTEIVGGGEKAGFDETDLTILKELSKNARTQLLEMAKKLGLDSMTVHHRIKKMEQNGIIQGYKTDFDMAILKRDFYSVKINLKNVSEQKIIEEEIKMIPEVTAMTEAIGSYDIEFDLEVENSEKYFQIIEKLENEFDSIREITYFRVLKSYKILYMPDI